MKALKEFHGTSKGKGFQGVVKRHGFAGVGQATHENLEIRVTSKRL